MKKVTMFARHEMLDLVLVEGKTKGIIARDLVSGQLKHFAADAAVLATGGYSRIFRLSTLALFTAAKINHLNFFPQGKPEAHQRVLDMTAQMEAEGLGHCSFTSACEMECPESISIAKYCGDERPASKGAAVGIGREVI